MSIVNRRNFLRGRPSSGAARKNPPWALGGDAFVETCTRCGDCARACPTRIIVQGDGGYPTIDFGKGECTFCGECVIHCQPKALLREADAAPWDIRADINDDCLAKHQVECRVCGEMCDAGAIRFPPRLGGVAVPVFDGERCTGCGACVAPCPVSAIRVA